MKYRYAMVCSSNQNRSMEAHSLLKRQRFDVSSYGTGAHVKLPGPSLREPNVYDFGTPYKHMLDDLRRKDPELYPPSSSSDSDSDSSIFTPLTNPILTDISVMGFCLCSREIQLSKRHLSAGRTTLPMALSMSFLVLRKRSLIWFLKVRSLLPSFTTLKFLLSHLVTLDNRINENGDFFFFFLIF